MLPISHVASPVKDWEWRTDPKVIEEINNELKELFENVFSTNPEEHSEIAKKAADSCWSIKKEKNGR
jgi:hypothetical protein